MSKFMKLQYDFVDVNDIIDDLKNDKNFIWHYLEKDDSLLRRYNYREADKYGHADGLRIVFIIYPWFSNVNEIKTLQGLQMWAMICETTTDFSEDAIVNIQTIYKKYSKTKNIKILVKQWLNEINDFDETNFNIRHEKLSCYLQPFTINQIENIYPINCSICLCEIENQVCLTKCNHAYHESCLEHWIHKNKTCPMCRMELKNHFDDDYDTDYDSEYDN